MRNPKTHVNLDKLARKLLADPPPDRLPDLIVERPTFETIRDWLQQERIELTDATFRQRYAFWL